MTLKKNKTLPSGSIIHEAHGPILSGTGQD
jgi:hypothetical protein